jgi:hypothetical protein
MSDPSQFPTEAELLEAISFPEARLRYDDVLAGVRALHGDLVEAIRQCGAYPEEKRSLFSIGEELATATGKLAIASLELGIKMMESAEGLR